MVLNVRKPDFVVHVKNRGTDQPAHPCSLISTCIICFLESTVVKAAPNKNLIGSLVAQWLSA